MNTRLEIAVEFLRELVKAGTVVGYAEVQNTLNFVDMLIAEEARTRQEVDDESSTNPTK